MICYSVQANHDNIINSDLRQALVIEAENEEDAKNRLHEVENREINYISSVSIFTWDERN